MYQIRIIPEDQLEVTIPLLRELNPQISDELLRSRQKEMIAQNYHCAGIYDGEKLIGISGIWILIKYYVGKHVELDNVYLKKEYQGQGLGNQLVEWILNYAKNQNCEASELNCYIENEGGNKFWSNLGYKPIGYHYQKKLN